MEKIVRCTEVFPLPNSTLLCKFDDGKWFLYDATSWLEYPAFSTLKNAALFNKVQLDYGNPTWREINEEITAYDIYVDGTEIDPDAAVRLADQYVNSLELKTI